MIDQMNRNVGERISALEAICLCCAMESAINFRAAVLSSREVRISVVRGGAASAGVEGCDGEGGRLCAEASGGGVEVCADIAE